MTAVPYDLYDRVRAAQGLEYDKVRGGAVLKGPLVSSSTFTRSKATRGRNRCPTRSGSLMDGTERTDVHEQHLEPFPVEPPPQPERPKMAFRSLAWAFVIGAVVAWFLIAWQQGWIESPPSMPPTTT